MKRKITFLIAALFAITLITQPRMVMGQSKGYSEMFTINSSDVVSSAYGSYTYTDGSSRGFLITYGGGANAVGSNKNNISSCKLTSYSKYAVSPVTTTNTASAFACTTSISNVSKISFKVGGGEYSTTQVYLIYSADDKTYSQITLTGSTEQGCSITTSAKEFEFSPLSGYFALVFTSNITNAAWRNQNVEIKFYKTTYNINYDANEATGGTVPTTTTHDAGSNATVASNTGSLVRTGYNFNGWNTQADGLGTDYAEGDPINSIAQDYTLYAKWTSASSPNIVVSGSGISSNALNLAHTASVDQTATASFNNMTGYTSPEVALYNDLACTEAFTGDWFSASLSGSTITYNASANAGAARTVYMRVSAVYSETTYYSNVITVTQAALPCTVTYDKNNAGASGSMSDGDSPYDYGSTVTVLDNDFTAPTGKVFYKWNTASDGSGTYYKKDDTFTITGNITLHAIWNDIPTYTMITSVSQIVPGAHYIIVGSNSSAPYTYKAMGAQNGSYRDAVVVYIKAKDTDDDGEDDTYYLQQAGLYEFVISGYTDNYTIYDETNTTKGFLYHNGDKNVNVRASIGNDNAALWKITMDNGLFKFNNVCASSYYLQYNSQSPRFTDYTGSQRNCYLFLKDNDTDIHPYSPTTYEEGTTVTISDNITIDNTNPITIEDGAVVRFTGSLTSTTATNIVIEDGGQLIVNNAYVQATIKKNVNVSARTDDPKWYTIASPVAGINLGAVSDPGFVVNLKAAGGYDLYRYNEKVMNWENYKNSAYHDGGADDFVSLEAGRGYLYRRDGAATLEYTGEVNGSASVTYSVTKEASNTDIQGFNLIGNPYSHDIYKGTGGALNDNKLNTGYYRLNNDASWGAVIGYGTAIKSGEGFLVQANTAGDITIYNNNNVATGNESKSGNDYIQFNVANGEYSDVAYALFQEGFGLNKINHRNPDVPMIYINLNNEDFAIAMMKDDTKSFNLNFKPMTMGKYTLSYKAEGDFNYLHVIDRLTGEDVDMLLEGEYSFISAPGDNENRFIVRLGYMPNNEGTENEIFAYQNGSDVIVSGDGELQVFDVTGRMVATQRVNGVETINISAQGVYIFRLNEKVQKIVVR